MVNGLILHFLKNIQTCNVNNQQKHKHMNYTEGLELAIEFGMEELYTELVENGATPMQALMEWN